MSFKGLMCLLVAGAVAMSSALAEWTCPQCTLLNKQMESYCAFCGADKPTKQAALKKDVAKPKKKKGAKKSTITQTPKKVIQQDIKQSKLEKVCPSCDRKTFFAKEDDIVCPDCQAAQEQQFKEIKVSKEEKELEVVDRLNAEIIALQDQKADKEKELQEAQATMSLLEDQQQKQDAQTNLVTPLVNTVKAITTQLAAKQDELAAKQSELDKLKAKKPKQDKAQQQRTPSPQWLSQEEIEKYQGKKSEEDAFKTMQEQDVEEAKLAKKEEEQVQKDLDVQRAELEKITKANVTEDDIKIPILGLRNCGGNSCFANSTLQCLFQLPPLQQEILGLDKNILNEAKNENSAYDHILQYRLLISALKAQKTGTFTPQAFCGVMRQRLPKEHRIGQQDAAEFLGAFVEDVKAVCSKNPFKIQYSQDIVDQKTKQSLSLRKDTGVLNNLAIPLDGDDFRQCLQAFLCSSLEYRNVPATQVWTVTQFPPVLVIQLMRFKQIDKKTVKLFKAIAFPVELKAAEYFGDDNKAAEGITYDLVGIVSHAGDTLQGGHYTSYVKSYADQSWHYCDNSKITKQTDQQIKAIAVAGVVGIFNPYLLFYLRR